MSRQAITGGGMIGVAEAGMLLVLVPDDVSPRFSSDRSSVAARCIGAGDRAGATKSDDGGVEETSGSA